MNLKFNILLIGMFFLSLVFVSPASLMVNDPTSCPSEDETVFPGVSCAPDDICGDDSGTPMCLDTSTIAVPSPTTSTANPGLPSPGFGVDCYLVGSSCANSIYCQRDSNCYNVHRLTQCTDWGIASCDTCISGYTFCDGSYEDGNGCEIDIGTTPYPSEDNAVYTAGCGPECSSGFLDCNTNLGSAVDGCEIESGVTPWGTSNAVYSTCTTATCESGWMACEGETATTDGCNYQIGSSCTTGDGKPGTWQSGCVCEELSQENFITNTLAKGWGDFLLWGEQWDPNGWLMNLTSVNGGSIGIDNESCIVFSDGSEMCGAGNLSVDSAEGFEITEGANGTVNISINGTGFFVYLGDFINRIENIFTKSIDVSENITLNGTTINDWGEISTDVNLTDYLRNDGDNATGRYNFDGKWVEGGVSIDSGDLFAQNLYVYNITSLAVNDLDINGSLIPRFNNTFDVGSSDFMWSRGYFADDIYVGGESLNTQLSEVNYTFTNGLNESGGTVRLGGTLNQDTTITGNHYLTLQSSNGVDAGSIYFSPGSLYLEVYGNTDSTDIDMSEDALFIQSSGSEIVLRGNQPMEFTSSNGIEISLSGNALTNGLMYYSSDYSLNYSNRTLVDKEYVDTIVSGAEADTSNYVPYTGATQDVDLGNYALTSKNFNVSDTNNLKIGDNAGDQNTGDYFIAIGIRSMYQNEGLYGTAVGSDSGRSNSGYHLIAYGSAAGHSNSGNSVIAIGYGAGYGNQGEFSSFFGRYAGDENLGNDSMGIGQNSLQNNSGNRVIGIGYEAGKDNVEDNLFIVQQSNVNVNPLIKGDFNSGNVTLMSGGDICINGGNCLSSVSSSVGESLWENVSGIATYDGSINVTGDYYGNKLEITNSLTRVGDGAGTNISGSNPVVIGTEAGYNSLGNFITTVGYRTGYNNKENFLTAFGAQAGYANTGDRVDAFGVSAASDNIGEYVVSIGANSGISNKGNETVFVGSLSGQQNKGNSNTFVGSFSGLSVEGSHIIGLGSYSSNSVTGDFGIGIGYNALLFNSGNYSIGIGNNALNNNSGDNVIAIGREAGYENTQYGDRSVMIGDYAGYQNNAADFTALGYNAGYGNDAYQVTAIGSNSGYNNEGYGLTSLGYQAGYNNTADNLIAFGSNAGYGNIGASTTAVGYWSGRMNIGDAFTGLGYYAGWNNQGNSTTFVGSSAGRGNIGSDSTSVGSNAGRSNIGVALTSLGNEAGYRQEGDNNIFIGDEAGWVNLGNEIIGIGNAAGYRAEANNLIAIGTMTGRDSISNNSIFIGREAGNDATGVNILALGRYAGSDISGSNVVAIGTMAGAFSNVSDSIYIGPNAGVGNVISNRLMIDNEFNNPTPLIDGRFDTNDLIINGDLNATGDICITGGNCLSNAADSSNYVPYTGATQDVDLGGYNLLSNNFYTSNLLGDPNAVVSIGYGAGNNNLGSSSTMVGALAGSNNEGTVLTAFGLDAGSGNEGNFSTFIGASTGQFNKGNSVIALGYDAGINNVANNSIYIGKDIGSNNVINNRLMIDIEDTQTPLIDGRFDSNDLIVNGDLNITGDLNVTGNIYLAGCIVIEGNQTLGTCA